MIRIELIIHDEDDVREMYHILAVLMERIGNAD